MQIISDVHKVNGSPSGPTDSIASGNAAQDALRRAAALSVRVADIAQQTDQSGSFPHQEFAWLAEADLLAVTLPAQPLHFQANHTGGLLQLLKLVGKGNLSVGRIYEGHINALYLIHLFARKSQQQRWFGDVQNKQRIFGVWNTQAQDGITLTAQGNGQYRLQGAKTFCSGAQWVTRPLITGTLIDEQGKEQGWQMAIVPLENIHNLPVDPSFWQPLGMKASVSYKIDFSDILLTEDDLLGKPDDYHRQPHFSGGAIRFAAVQLGGAEAIFDATRQYLRALHRTDDPYQQMRLGEMAVLIETGNLWLRQAGEQADRREDPEKTIGYANMTRTAIEKLCLEIMPLAERCVGARGLLQPHPFARLHADLTTYLRQPAPDAAVAGIGTYVAQRETPAHALWSKDA